MAQENNKTTTPKKDEEQTGSDISGGDGTVSDEDVNAITDDGSGKPTGQDHSLEDYEKSEPESGVGAIQDNSLIKENVAHIED
jgi:hypothetical protein